MPWYLCLVDKKWICKCCTSYLRGGGLDVVLVKKGCLLVKHPWCVIILVIGGLG